MVTIKIILLGHSNLFPCFKHIAAIITDTDTNRVFLLNHPFGSYDHSDERASQPDKALKLYQGSTSNFCVRTVMLYSRLSYDGFLLTFNNDFHREFSWLSNNCANAVAKMLNYFFPNAANTSSHTYLQMICFPIALVTLVLEAYDVETPPSVLARAEALEASHGFDSLSAEEKDVITNHSQRSNSAAEKGPKHPSWPTLDEKVMLNVLRPLGLI